MFEKIKQIFKQKDKKIENLIFLLFILIITLICINYIMKDDTKEDEKKHAGAVLASSQEVYDSDLESRIENILGKIDGVGKVSVLLTYADESLEGIVIVAEGVNNLDTKVNIISAVEAVTGLGKHKIKVYEMKEIENSGGNYGEENQYGEN